MRVLLVEDDTASAKSIELMLKSEGYVCDSTAFGEDCLAISKFTNYDLIILDLMLPDMDGYETLRRLRTAKIQWPILILSGLNGPEEKIKGLSLGADDYLAKPFDRGELVARIETLVRRSEEHPERIIHTGKIAVNLDNRTVLVNGKLLCLPHKEFEILALLSLCKGEAVTKDRIINHLYKNNTGAPLKFIDVLICRLRRYLSDATGEDTNIHTVWGCGYELCDPQIASVSDRPVETDQVKF